MEGGSRRSDAGACLAGYRPVQVRAVYVDAARRIAGVIEARASALRAAASSEIAAPNRERLEAMIATLRDDVDAFEAALWLSEEEWDRGSEPSLAFVSSPGEHPPSSGGRRGTTVMASMSDPAAPARS